MTNHTVKDSPQEHSATALGVLNGKPFVAKILLVVDGGAAQKLSAVRVNHQAETVKGLFLVGLIHSVEFEAVGVAGATSRFDIDPQSLVGQGWILGIQLFDFRYGFVR